MLSVEVPIFSVFGALKRLNKGFPIAIAVPLLNWSEYVNAHTAILEVKVPIIEVVGTVLDIVYARRTVAGPVIVEDRQALVMVIVKTDYANLPQGRVPFRVII